MKNLTNLSIIALLIALSSESYGQTFGLKAGYNINFMAIEKGEFALPYETYNVSTKMKNGFHFGGTVEYPVYKMFSLESGLIYSNTGYSQFHEETIWPKPLKVTDTYNLGFLNVPLVVKAFFPVGSVNIYGSAGGYVGLGLAGNMKTVAIYGDTTESEKRTIKWGSEQSVDDLKKIDYGLTFGAGVKVKSFQIGVSYNMGLANLSPASKAGSIINNSSLGISFGYLFGKSKKAEPVSQMVAQNVEEKKAQSASGKSRGKKAAALEAERVRLEKVRSDSIAAVKIEEERLRIEKVKADSIATAKIIAATRANEEVARLAKIKADSISAAQNTVIYRVQFASNTAKKGSYDLIIGGVKQRTWEYFYSGAFRSTVGEFKTFKSALEFQNTVRKSGYPQAFVVAFKNNIRITDPALFK